MYAQATNVATNSSAVVHASTSPQRRIGAASPSGSQLTITVARPHPPATTSGIVSHENVVTAPSTCTDQLISAQPTSVHQARCGHDGPSPSSTAASGTITTGLGTLTAEGVRSIIGPDASR